jgi:flagellar hook-associated protein 3 FlgL
MRITNRMAADRSLAGLQALSQQVQHAQDQITSGRRIVRPSDDPAATHLAVRLHDSLAQTNQYLRNIDAADARMSVAEGAFSVSSDVMLRATELGVQGANGSLSPSDRAVMAKEVEALARTLVQQAATRSGSDCVFSGYQTNVPPYAEAPAGSAAVSAYAGDSGQRLARIGPGVTLPENVTADVAFKPALDALAQLHADLLAGGPVQGSTLTAIAAGHAALTDARTELGARQARLAQAQQSLGDLQLVATRLLSNLEDVDVAEAVTALTSHQNAYDAAAKANGRILATSLLDYLR